MKLSLQTVIRNAYTDCKDGDWDSGELGGPVATTGGSLTGKPKIGLPKRLDWEIYGQVGFPSDTNGAG